MIVVYPTVLYYAHHIGVCIYIYIYTHIEREYVYVYVARVSCSYLSRTAKAKA